MDLTNPQITLRQARIEALEAELAKEQEKVKELAKDLSRVLGTVKYLRGIAERGSGDRCPEDMTVEKFVLGYVKKLEQHIRNQNEQLEQQAETRKLALDAAVSSSCVLAAELADERKKRAADNAQYSADEIEWNKQLAAAQATITEMRGYFWRDVSDELPKEAQEVLFVRDNKVVHGAWINGIFWHSNTKMAAAKWMPFPPVDISTLPTNQDALHEARAQALEEAVVNWSYGLGGHREEIELKAAAHRAKKGEGK